MNLKPAHEVVGELKQARTLRDIYRLPFPLAAPLQLSSPLLNDFWTQDGSGGFRTEIVTDAQGHETWQDNADKEPALRGVIQTVADFDSVSGNVSAVKKMEFELRDPDCRVNNFVERPHCDGAVKPTMRVAFYASVSPTYVVSHTSMLSIFNNDSVTRALLDMPFADPEFYRDFSEACHDLSGVFARAARQITEREYTLISGVTPHFMPHDKAPGRRFLRTRTYEV